MAQSVTMLKNEDSALPLDKTKLKSVAVIGPNAKQAPPHTACLCLRRCHWYFLRQSSSIFSYYGPTNSCDGEYWTMVDAVQQHVSGHTPTFFGSATHRLISRHYLCCWSEFATGYCKCNRDSGCCGSSRGSRRGAPAEKKPRTNCLELIKPHGLLIGGRGVGHRFVECT